MNVITIALGVALGLLLLELVLRLLCAVLVGAIELYEYIRPEPRLLYEVDPVDGSINTYAIGAQKEEMERVMDTLGLYRDNTEYMPSESVDVDRSDDNESRKAGDGDE